jgi:glycosyltransferase involved in cell wall biosynthesis
LFKILVIAEFSSFGGTRTFFTRLIELYRSSGLEVVVGLTTVQVDPRMQVFLEKMETRVCLFPERPKGLGSVWNHFPCSEMFDLYCYYGFLRRHKADMVVVSNGTPGQFLGLAAVPGRFLYVAHTYPELGRVVKWPKRLKQFLFRSLFSSDRKRIVTVSRFSSECIKRVWFGGTVREGTVCVIYNSGYVDRKKAIMADAADDRQRVIVLTLGHVAQHKNPAGWFRVAKRVIHAAAGAGLGCSFIWAGDGDLLEQYRELARNSGLGENVQFLGFQEDVGGLYRRASLYFQPSLVESHGISVLDAMQFGIPAVVSDIGGLPESVVDGETGFVVPVTDEEGMAQKLFMLIQDHALAKKFGESSRSRYQQLFSHHRWVKEVVRVHAELGAALIPHDQ